MSQTSTNEKKASYVFCGTYEQYDSVMNSKKRVAHFTTPGMGDAEVTALKKFCQEKNNPGSRKSEFNAVRLRIKGLVIDAEQIKEKLPLLNSPGDIAQFKRAQEVLEGWNKPRPHLTLAPPSPELEFKA